MQTGISKVKCNSHQNKILNIHKLQRKMENSEY